MAVINSVLFSKDLGGLGYMSQFLPPKKALLLMSAWTEPYTQFEKDIKDHIRFSNTMEVLFKSNKLSKIKEEYSTFDKAMKVWKSSDSDSFKSNIEHWENFCEIDNKMIKLKRKTKISLIKELEKMTIVQFSQINLKNFEFMNKDDTDQSYGESFEIDEGLSEIDADPERCIYRDSSSGFGVIQFVAGNTYFGQLNDNGQPHGDGTVIIYNPDNPQLIIHENVGQWKNGKLEIESQVFRVLIEHETPGIFVGIKEGSKLKGIFYEPSGENKNAEIDNQGNFSLSY